jgi:arginine-tRNA-protein transferase
MYRQIRQLGAPHQCSYLPDQTAQIEYEFVSELTPQAYGDRLSNFWRRFGYTLFRPRCPACNACEPIRTIVEKFQPDRSQRRVMKANRDETKLVISEPTIDRARVELYYRHHNHHSEQKGWTEPTAQSTAGHLEVFLNTPYPTEEWAFYRDDRLIAISYIDQISDGLSGVYFYFDPDYRHLSPGTWICLSMIEQAALRGLPYAYFGYLVMGCRSMEYKARFKPYEILTASGIWQEPPSRSTETSPQ